MRVNRIVSAFAALLLASALPLLGPGPATASSHDRAELAMKTRDIGFQFRKQGQQAYKFQGTVTPKSMSKNISVKLLRANCKSCKYKPFRSTRTNQHAFYSFTGLKRFGWFTVKVPASNGFATSYATKSIHVFPA
jgi:hypothetical protein